MNHSLPNTSLITSPCISQCTLNDDDICVGCFRHIDEITGWHGASNDRRQEILNNCEKRKLAKPNFFEAGK